MRTDDFQEVELKLEIASSDLESLLNDALVTSYAKGTAVETAELDTVYFDTAARDLAAAGFALRIRRDGAERIQAVKGKRSGAGGLSSRLEVETSIDGDRPDLERIPDAVLAAELRAIVADAPLVPTLRTAFTRRSRVLGSGGSEWRFELDDGEIIAGEKRAPIRELELELCSGDAAPMLEFALALVDRAPLVPATASKASRGGALARGVPPKPRRARRLDLEADASVRSAFDRVISECLDHFTANAAAARDGEAEALHQARIGVQRTRAAFALFGAAFRDEARPTFAAELDWLGGVLDAARDVEVITRGLLRAAETAGETSAMDALRAEARTLRGRSAESVREALRSPRYARLVLETLLRIHGRKRDGEDEATPVKPYAAATLARWRKDVLDVTARAPGSLEALRAQRPYVERLRDAGEFFATVFPEEPATLDRVADVQRVLDRSHRAALARDTFAALLDRIGFSAEAFEEVSPGFASAFFALVGPEEDGLAAVLDRLRHEPSVWNA